MRIPWTLRAPVRRARNALAARRAVVEQGDRWLAIATTPPRRDGLAVSYGVEQMTPEDGVVFGGAVKFHLLDRELPNAPRDFNVLYLGSSWLSIDAPKLVALARERDATFVWNQNGVAYPGWHGEGWQLANRVPAQLAREADFVVYQSAFCKLAADTFYGPRDLAWEVLHNPVDTTRFVPAARPADRPLTLLLGGNQYQRYRIERALETLVLVRQEHPDARLLVTGALSFAPDAEQVVAGLVERLGLAGAVELLGTYSQHDAPALMQRADVLLHPKVNDPCPTIVLEAMASGLPVVYSATGGTPELVGADGGVGIAGVLDWEHDRPPAAEALASAVLDVAGDLPARSAAARQRSLAFDARKWVERHLELFSELAGARKGDGYPGTS